MLKVAVLDDEKIFCESIRERIYSIYRNMHVAVEVDDYHFSRELLYEVDDGAYYDIYLLDIELPDMSGMELAQKLREKAPYCYIIFLTAYPQFAIEGYDLRAYQYLLKDEWEKKLTATLKKIQAEMAECTNPSYRIIAGARYEKIPVKDIYYICKDGKNALFHTKNGLSSVRKSLSEIFEELPEEQFMYVDRGYIANIQQIMKLKNRDVYMANGEVIPVSGPQLETDSKKIDGVLEKECVEIIYTGRQNF